MDPQRSNNGKPGGNAKMINAVTITMCRMLLLDPHCIIQDSEPDWKIPLSPYYGSDIYGFSFLTMSAASSADSHSAFLFNCVTPFDSLLHCHPAESVCHLLWDVLYLRKVSPMCSVRLLFFKTSITCKRKSHNYHKPLGPFISTL